MYLLSYIDRTNIAMAIPAMRAELHMSAAAIGQATSVFFWGYIVLQIPTGRLATIWSPKKVVFLQLLAWAAISLTTAFVQTETQLWYNRFALGLAEGGVLTCTLTLIRGWFTRAERARANTVFLLSLTIAPMIANPISGMVLYLANWRTMFMLEACSGASSGCGPSLTRRTRRNGCRRRSGHGWWPPSRPRRRRFRRGPATGRACS